MSNFANQPKADEDRPRRFSEAIVTMLEPLPAQERDMVLQLVTERLRPISAPRAGEVLGAVILAFPQRDKWSVEALRETVQAQGVQAAPKEIYNALGYLVRKGRIRRVAYGQYVLGGAGIEIEGTDDGTLRESEHYS